MTPTSTGSPTPSPAVTPGPAALSDPPRVCQLCTTGDVTAPLRPDGRIELLLCEQHTVAVGLAGLSPADRAEYDRLHAPENQPYHWLPKATLTPIMRLLPDPMFYVTFPADLLDELLPPSAA